MRFRFILFAMLAGLLPCMAALLGIVKFYESRAVELRTAEIQNQCTILSNQLSNYGYLADTSSEVINTSLTQLTNIYNGRGMVMDQDLKVIKDTYSLDEGKTDVSENVVRCMNGERTNYYDRTNHYIEVTSPIVDSGGVQIAVFGGFHLFGKAGPVQAGDPDDLAGFRDVQRIQRQRIRRREQKPRLYGPCVPPGKQDIEQRRRAP